MPIGLTIGYEMYIKIRTIGANVAPMAKPYLEHMAACQLNAMEVSLYLHWGKISEFVS